MNYLLDTHIILWSLFDPERLTKNIQSVLINHPGGCFVSSISFFEISLKFGLGKLQLNGLTPEDIFLEVKRLNYHILELSSEVTYDFYKLPQKIHQDPFDKMIVWQAIKNKMTLLSADDKLQVFVANGLKISY
ncbi:MAG: type II toxin-antitoxin system VapC family toxin [Bacteroidota bacterium]|nr:type II toxin-antitoxin system VapC family toxin [Bacteroidota bacterium]